MLSEAMAIREYGMDLNDEWVAGHQISLTLKLFTWICFALNVYEWIPLNHSEMIIIPIVCIDNM